jgi:hypothetical protein
MTELDYQNRMLQLVNNGSSALGRIKNSLNYKKEFTYSGATSNITIIVHTGSTPKGIEVVTQTISYENPAVEGSRITSIILS